MKIVSWNVNSVRARIDNISDFLSDESVDCLLLQEIKCQEKDFPYDTFHKMGYKTAVYGQKAYNGVAILSKYPIANIEKSLNDKENDEARYIECDIDVNGIRFCIASVYVPNGRLVGSDYFKYCNIFKKLKEKYKTSCIKMNYLLLEVITM